MTVAEIYEQVRGWNGRVHCSNSQCGVLTDWDPTKRIPERLVELGAPIVRASPDICHMLIGPDGWAPQHYGYALVCDPQLPKNSIVAADGD